ncbi:hypothetical protein NCAS_0E01290 [Naumovozyma castellii]|uniref:Uncharacterized protein n=1 Tax=Naumovozyma castellii TaxID=27288 RepID=G0VFD3_NAUCA|nr:hypothetical protein NCAS_0E01290 [Naumovozyma castellii CBS 4309]CCC70199.1 hypothetical protein NCAS_0E01290 [Naumovozyma castellii CBS 4309]
MVSFLHILSLTAVAFASTVPTYSNKTDVTPEAFFSNIQLTDAYSGNANCSDPNHWFLVEGELFVPQGTDSDLYFTIPRDFGSLPDGPFDLLFDSSKIGSINYNDSNIFTVSFLKEELTSNVTTTFNFLTKLSGQSQLAISGPQQSEYTFNVSSGTAFTETINYIAPDISDLTTNGGIEDGNNTAWFTANIPISTFLEPVDFISQLSDSNKFDISSLSIEIVTSVGSFNQPLTSVPFTAVDDQSTSSQIKLLFDTNLSGGKYVRISYSSDSLNAAIITSQVELLYPNVTSTSSNLVKRDTSIVLDSVLYASAMANIDTTSNPSADSESTVPDNVSLTNDIYKTFILVSSVQSEVLTEFGTYIPITTFPNDTSSVTSMVSNSSASTTAISTSVTETISTSSEPSVAFSTSVIDYTSSSVSSTSDFASPSFSKSNFFNSTTTTSTVNPATITDINTSYQLLTSTQAEEDEYDTELIPINTLHNNNSTKIETITSCSNGCTTSVPKHIVSTELDVSKNSTQITSTIAAELSEEEYLLGSSTISTKTSSPKQPTVVNSLDISKNTTQVTSTISAELSEEEYLLGSSVIPTSTSIPEQSPVISTDFDIFKNSTEVTSTIPADLSEEEYLLGASTITTSTCAPTQSPVVSTGLDIFKNSTQITSTISADLSEEEYLLGASTIPTTKNIINPTVTKTQNSKKTMTITSCSNGCTAATAPSFISSNSTILRNSTQITSSLQAQVTELNSLLGSSVMKTSYIHHYSASQTTSRLISVFEAGASHIRLTFGGALIALAAQFL